MTDFCSTWRVPEQEEAFACSMWRAVNGGDATSRGDHYRLAFAAIYE